MGFIVEDVRRRDTTRCERLTGGLDRVSAGTDRVSEAIRRHITLTRQFGNRPQAGPAGYIMADARRPSRNDSLTACSALAQGARQLHGVVLLATEILRKR
jgi:hypothetical protein